MTTKEKATTAKKYFTLDEMVGDMTPECRSHVDALKEELRSEIVAYNLAELRHSRQVTQAALARRMKRAQVAGSNMENIDDHLVSTIRSVVESLGGSS